MGLYPLTGGVDPAALQAIRNSDSRNEVVRVEPFRRRLEDVDDIVTCLAPGLTSKTIVYTHKTEMLRACKASGSPQRCPERDRSKDQSTALGVTTGRSEASANEKEAERWLAKT